MCFGFILMLCPVCSTIFLASNKWQPLRCCIRLVTNLTKQFRIGTKTDCLQMRSLQCYLTLINRNQLSWNDKRNQMIGPPSIFSPTEGTSVILVATCWISDMDSKHILLWWLWHNILSLRVSYITFIRTNLYILHQGIKQLTNIKHVLTISNILVLFFSIFSFPFLQSSTV